MTEYESLDPASLAARIAALDEQGALDAVNARIAAGDDPAAADGGGDLVRGAHRLSVAAPAGARSGSRPVRGGRRSGRRETGSSRSGW